MGEWNAKYRHWKREINAKRWFGHSFSCIFWISKMNIQCNSNAILAQNQTSPFWTSNCTLMTMSRSRFEGCLNTVWRGLAAEALFWAHIYYIMNGCRYMHTHALCAYEGTKKGASLPQSWRSMSRSLFPRLRGVFWCIWHLSGVPVQGMVNAGQTHVPVLSIQSWEKSP